MRTVVLDIGGTSIKSGIYEKGKLLYMQENPSDAGQGGRYLMERATDIIRSYQSGYFFERIGISTTGQVDPVEGCILYANHNVPGYTGMCVRRYMEEIFGMPVVVENDVNAAAVGEAMFGAGVGEKDFLCMTIGTGIGGAVFLDGRLYRGGSFTAGEFGAMVLHPDRRDAAGDMFSGCFEKFASATALVERVKRSYPQITDGRAVFAHLNNSNIRTVVDEWIEEIVNGMVTLIHIFNPAVFILGGGVMEQDYILDSIRERVPGQIMPLFRTIEIRKAALGNRAGLYGIGAVAEGDLSCVERSGG